VLGVCGGGVRYRCVAGDEKSQVVRRGEGHHHPSTPYRQGEEKRETNEDDECIATIRGELTLLLTKLSWLAYK
jgi:hypothetical protein